MQPQLNVKLRGFSLVELTVVLLLITLLANVAVRSSSELAFEARFQQTQERLELIKQAILGNPKQVVNGQQAISGFVADMGRLPNNIHELLEANFCSIRKDATGNYLNTSALCLACNWYLEFFTSI